MPSRRHNSAMLGLAPQTIQHDADLLFRRMPFAGCTADVLHDPLRRRFRMHGFLSHLHSLVVTMSQISFVPQAAKSVSQALMSDKWTPSAGDPYALERLNVGPVAAMSSKNRKPVSAAERMRLSIGRSEGTSSPAVTCPFSGMALAALTTSAYFPRRRTISPTCGGFVRAE